MKVLCCKTEQRILMAVSDFNMAAKDKIQGDSFYKFTNNRYEIDIDTEPIEKFARFVDDSHEHSNFFWVEIEIEGFKSYERAVAVIETFNKRNNDYYIDPSSSITQIDCASVSIFTVFCTELELAQKFWEFVNTSTALKEKIRKVCVEDNVEVLE